MPPLPDVNKCLRLAFVGSYGPDLDVVNRIFMEYSGTPPTNLDLDSLAAACCIAWGSFISPMQSPAYVLESCSIEDLSSSLAATGAHAVATTGTRGGGALPNDVCGVMQNRIQRRYRGGHCRTYLAVGTLTDLANNNTWNAGFIAAMVTAWEDFIAAVSGDVWLAGGTLFQVNVSYFSGFTNVLYPSGRYRAVPTRRVLPLLDGISSYSLNPHLGSQRRRNQQSS